MKYIICIHIWPALTTVTSNPLCQRTIKPNEKMSLDDYAVTTNVGFCRRY